MSVSFGHRNHFDLFNGHTGRQIPVSAHEGPYRAFLRRHERSATDAAARGRAGVAESTPGLLERIADSRNIRVAADRVIENGGVPGPDGLNCGELSSSKLWELSRTLKQCLQMGTYRHGLIRTQRIEKPSGGGYRTIHVENHIDRIVARAVLQILQPLVDPAFDENSFGFRPGRDRRHALRTALDLLDEGYQHWAVADIKDAFDNIPLQRLLDVVLKQLPGIEETVIELIEHVASTGRKRGIRQGSPLSPFLMNIYLNHLLDGVWRKLSPDEPLLRTADDLLVCCRTPGRAHSALDRLAQVLKPTGMRLNSKKSVVHNLQQGRDTADWLGFSVRQEEQGPVVRIAESAWQSLGNKLEEAHYKPGSPIRATQSLSGWLDQLGPCYAKKDVGQVHERVVAIAEELAFDEMPDLYDFKWCWWTAYARWRRLCSLPLSARNTPGGSARHTFFPAARDRRSDGALPGAPSLSFAVDETVTLYTDGACDRLTRLGGWGAILMAPSLACPVRGSGCLKRTTNNRAELIAVVKGLERLRGPARVLIVSDSKYVTYGITQGLPKWKAQGWRAGSGRHKRDLQNVDLWKTLDALIDPHTVTCEWVRGHSGDMWNEECDRLAVASLERAAG